MVIDILDAPKIDAWGFDEQGIHDDTGTKYDLDGYNKQGYDKQGYDKAGFNAQGWDKSFKNKHTGTLYSTTGHDVRGFDREGMHRDTKTKYNSAGFDKEGYNPLGLDKRHFYKSGLHAKTNRFYDPWGFDKGGMHRDTNTCRDLDGYKRIELMSLELLNKLGEKKQLRYKYKDIITSVDVAYDAKTKKYLALGVNKKGKLMRIAGSKHRGLALSYLRRALLPDTGYKYKPWGYVVSNPREPQA